MEFERLGRALAAGLERSMTWSEELGMGLEAEWVGLRLK